MARTPASRPGGVRLCDYLIVGVIARVFPCDSVRAALADCGRLSFRAWPVRRILRMLGLTLQDPKRRSVRYNPGDATRWNSESFAKISKRAQERGATPVVANESGLSSPCVY